MHHIERILGPVEPMLQEISAWAHLDGIDISSHIIDHVCYRIASIERYEELKKILDSMGRCIGEYMIAGRPIATILLNEPIRYENFKIECIELPAPKTESPYSEWWEHAECALGITPHNFANQYPLINFDTRAVNKDINPDVSRKYGEYTVKFHEHTLRYVVEVLQA